MQCKDIALVAAVREAGNLLSQFLDSTQEVFAVAMEYGADTSPPREVRRMLGALLDHTDRELHDDGIIY